MPAFPINATLERDNTDRFAQVTGVHETNTPRDLNLIIERSGRAFRLRVQCTNPAIFDPTDGLTDVDIPLTAEQLWGVVGTCRESWRTNAIDHQQGGRFVLQDSWDFGPNARSALPASILAELALAGLDLFDAIFFPDEAKADPQAYSKLTAVGTRLRTLANRGDHLWIRVTSDEFYAPWNLLYPKELNRKDGRDATPSGFWGYQHVVEHVPMPPRAGESANRGQDLVVNQPFRIALQLDQEIDATLRVVCLGAVRSELAAYQSAGSLALVERNSSRELGDAFVDGALDDHILYFCCHAKSEGDSTTPALNASSLGLTDRNRRITPTLIRRWLNEKDFKNGPVVFLNACQSGQMNSTFHRGFVPSFLSRRASAFIGTQTEVPAAFAGEFARRFFERFLAGGTSLGKILWDLRREFLDTHANPLGLLYASYRGADVTLPVGLKRKGASA